MLAEVQLPSAANAYSWSITVGPACDGAVGPAISISLILTFSRCVDRHY